MHEIASVVLAIFLLVAGVVHGVAPARVQSLVPEWWPAKRATVYLSGLAELVLGVGLLVASTRATAGLLAAVLFVAYAGVHADDARHARTATTRFGSPLGVTGRVLANLGYAAWAGYVAVGG
ncbi:hypothetical protein [Georgenia alba]|uniref:DoxX family membrane protein n=1 Tax=Georgenia alba TaxID=2233858 RepID=A0ABW2Q2Q6_9MICO